MPSEAAVYYCSEATAFHFEHSPCLEGTFTACESKILVCAAGEDMCMRMSTHTVCPTAHTDSGWRLGRNLQEM